MKKKPEKRQSKTSKKLKKLERKSWWLPWRCWTLTWIVDDKAKGTTYLNSDFPSLMDNDLSFAFKWQACPYLISNDLELLHATQSERHLLNDVSRWTSITWIKKNSWRNAKRCGTGKRFAHFLNSEIFLGSDNWKKTDTIWQSSPRTTSTHSILCDIASMIWWLPRANQSSELENSRSVEQTLQWKLYYTIKSWTKILILQRSSRCPVGNSWIKCINL